MAIAGNVPVSRALSQANSFDNRDLGTVTVDANDSISQTRNQNLAKLKTACSSKPSVISYSNLTANSKCPVSLWDALRLHDANKYQMEV